MPESTVAGVWKPPAKPPLHGDALTFGGGEEVAAVFVPEAGYGHRDIGQQFGLYNERLVDVEMLLRWGRPSSRTGLVACQVTCEAGEIDLDSPRTV